MGGEMRDEVFFWGVMDFSDPFINIGYQRLFYTILIEMLGTVRQLTAFY